MLAIPDSILKEAASVSNSPRLYLDIWATRGERVRIDKTSEWKGLNDPALLLDTNISFNRKRGAAMLAQGVYVPVAGVDLISKTAHNLSLTIHTGAAWHTVGNWLSGTGLQHDYFYNISTVFDTAKKLPFVSNTSFLLDTMRLLVSNSGNSATDLIIRIIDSNGNQVGNQSKVPISAGFAVASVDVAGLSATLKKGGFYSLELDYTHPSATGVAFVSDTVYTVNLDVFSYSIAALTHTIETATGEGFSIGGQLGFQSTGSFYRSLTMNGTPVGQGSVNVRDVVPLGNNPTSMIITLYFTDSPIIAANQAITGWTQHGVIASGELLPTHKFWRAYIQMTSNTLNDESPELLELSISYIGDPITIGEQLEIDFIQGSTTLKQVTTFTGLESVSAASGQLTAKPSKSMVGRITCVMLPDFATNDLVTKFLRGRPCQVRAGYVRQKESIVLMTGIARDIAFTRGKYSLTIEDNIELADVQIPRKKAGIPWNSSTATNSGKIVVYGQSSWLALFNILAGIAAPLPADGVDGDYFMDAVAVKMYHKTAGVWDAGTAGITPDLYPLAWQNNGTVWQNIDYVSAKNAGAAWHLADIAKDIITNHINLFSQDVDLVSLDNMKTRFPLRVGTRVIAKPAKAFEMLAEIAWLLEAQWIVRLGKLTLVPEAISSDLPVEIITADDVAAGISWSRGWKNLKNESLILSQYDGVGETGAAFAGGVAIGVADIGSINNYDVAILDVFRDKWNVPESELKNIATSFINRWKDGRRTITNARVSMRLMRLEAGDIVMLYSNEFPKNERVKLKMMLIKKDLNWKRQEMSCSFVEVQ